MIVTIDIETKPGSPNWIKSDIAEHMHPPGNIKKKETIDSWWHDKAPVIAEEKYHSAGLEITSHLLQLALVMARCSAVADPK